LEVKGLPPSRQIARLNRLVELADSRKNPIWLILSTPLFGGLHLAYAVEGWRKTAGAAVRRWLEAVGELEALVALGAYAYEHPADVFPELASGAVCLESEALGHPLLADAHTVRNEVVLNTGQRVLIVSGSNMSGKSTLLRAVGVNVVLAMAGAPVRARRMRLSPLAVGASIRVLDSLQSGRSRFYAEIQRLRQLFDITVGSVPLLFLLDELLQGTNSHDRRIGSQSIIQGLVRHGAIGLITTHDLALTEIASLPQQGAANVHFEDRIEDGRMVFDYQLRPGVVQKSNALELMRSIGLKI
jgi:DNA mismatch repair ATPase MutS